MLENLFLEASDMASLTLGRLDSGQTRLAVKLFADSKEEFYEHQLADLLERELYRDLKSLRGQDLPRQ